jgi:hypothetical protein
MRNLDPNSIAALLALESSRERTPPREITLKTRFYNFQPQTLKANCMKPAGGPAYAISEQSPKYFCKYWGSARILVPPSTKSSLKTKIVFPLN